MARKSALSLLLALTILWAILFLAAMNVYAQSSEKAECEWEEINNQIKKIERAKNEELSSALKELNSFNLSSCPDDKLKELLIFLKKKKSKKDLTVENKEYIDCLITKYNYILWKPKNNQLIEKIKNSTKENFGFYLTELASVNLASDADDNLRGLLSFLKEIESEREKLASEKLTHEDKKHVLYLKAECNYKLKKYDPAHKQYLQLKLILDDKEDPLFLEVQTRLKQTSKKAKRAIFKDKKIKWQKYWPHILIFPLFLFIILILFPFIFNNRCLRWFLKRFSFASEIVPEKKLIKLEEMRRQDGRASEQEVKEYKEGDHAGRDNKSGTYACLIVEGHEMIERVNKCAPYHITLISKIPLRRWLSPFWIFTLFGFVFVILWGLLSDSFDGIIFEDGQNMGIIKLGFLAALVISSLTGIRIMSQKTIRSLDEVVSMMEGHSPGPKTGKKKNYRPQSIRDLEEWIKSLFRSPWQFFPVLLILPIIYLRMPTIADKSFTSMSVVIDCLFISLLVLLVCPVIWLLGKSLHVLDKICTMEDLSINPLSPLKTMGLQKWISVIGTYAIVGSIVLTFGTSIPVVCHFISGKIELSSWFWFILIFPLLIVYWVYPYQKLASLVKSMKVKRMHFFKTKISQIFNEWVFEEEQLQKLGQENIAKSRIKMFERLKPQLQHMNTYYYAFKRIDQSPESFFDFNSVVELAKAIGLPSLFAFLLTLLSQLY